MSPSGNIYLHIGARCQLNHQGNSGQIDLSVTRVHGYPPSNNDDGHSLVVHPGLAELERLLPERGHTYVPIQSLSFAVDGRFGRQLACCDFRWPEVRKWARRADVGESPLRCM
jgi:hypothetical protein